jgi:hypothetical protein
MIQKPMNIRNLLEWPAQNVIEKRNTKTATRYDFTVETSWWHPKNRNWMAANLRVNQYSWTEKWVDVCLEFI